MVDLTKLASFSEKEKSNQDSNEAALVIRARQGDKQAFDVLYVRYCGQIKRYLSRMVGDDNAACDLAQDTFLKAWSQLPSLREPTRFTSWLYRIAQNCARDYQRHLGRLQLISLSVNAS